MPTTELVLPVAHETAFIVVWEYQVKPEFVVEFVSAYGADGDWARLFRRSPEFVGVDLLASTENYGRFYTFDRWASSGGRDEFLAVQATAYDVLDRRLSSLVVWERRIGAFPPEG
jgi:hypothetical protein